MIGVFTGALVLGAMPLIENGFKVATDATLFELTDFNHPLLRQMQVDAPGTYHHSLMVANLSENAAVAVEPTPSCAELVPCSTTSAKWPNRTISPRTKANSGILTIGGIRP